MKAIFISITAFLSVFTASTNAHSEFFPNIVDSYINKFENACGRPVVNGNSKRASGIVQIENVGQNGVVYIVDGSKTACEDSYIECGTGGCPLVVLKSTAGKIQKLFESQVLDWSLASSAPLININLHGGLCGRGGPASCAATLNLLTGEKRVFIPRK